MAQTAPQFDPIEQLSAALNAYEICEAEMAAIMPRLRFSFERIEAELENVRKYRDQLDVFTEAEAAAVLKLTETSLAAYRRDNDLPHLRFGSMVRYTRQHLDQIVSFFESRNAGKSQLRRAA